MRGAVLVWRAFTGRGAARDNYLAACKTLESPEVAGPVETLEGKDEYLLVRAGAPQLRRGFFRFFGLIQSGGYPASYHAYLWSIASSSLAK